MPTFVVQIIGISAMLINLIAYQTKTQRSILIMQFFSTALFSVHYFFLGAMAGCLLNVVAVARAAVFSQVGRRRFASSPLWVPAFIVACAGVYVLSFTVFGVEWNVANAVVELLPVLGMAIQTVGLRLQNAQRVRIAIGASMPCWFSYNAVRFSVGGMLSDLATTTSVVVGYLRYRKSQGK